MDVHHVCQLADGGVLAHQHADLLDDVGAMGTVGVTTEDGSPTPNPFPEGRGEAAGEAGRGDEKLDRKSVV